MLAFLFHDLISLDSVDEADETPSTCCTIPANGVMVLTSCESSSVNIDGQSDVAAIRALVGC